MANRMSRDRHDLDLDRIMSYRKLLAHLILMFQLNCIPDSCDVRTDLAVLELKHTKLPAKVCESF